MPNRLKNRGFTIVELLIVIVVIGILAAIVVVTYNGIQLVVAYNGIQQKGRDAQRQSDIRAITTALEMYYLDEGQYPAGTGANSSTTINSSWSTTADSSWANLRAKLVPKYIASLPSDPVSTPGVNVQNSGYNYAYFADRTGYYCSSTPAQMYILIYRLEGSPRTETLKGDCNTSGPPYNLFYSQASNYRVVK